MKKAIVYLAVVLMLFTVGTALALDIDPDSNDAVEEQYGGTNLNAICADGEYIVSDGTDYQCVTSVDTDDDGDADTIQVTDDESTDDAHEVVFTTDNSALESDGTLNYNPSTGTLEATIFTTSSSNPYFHCTNADDTNIDEEGRFCVNTTDHTFQWHDGTNISVGVDTDTAQTLTNKTIDATATGNVLKIPVQICNSFIAAAVGGDLGNVTDYAPWRVPADASTATLTAFYCITSPENDADDSIRVSLRECNSGYTSCVNSLSETSIDCLGDETVSAVLNGGDDVTFDTGDWMEVGMGTEQGGDPEGVTICAEFLVSY